MSEFEKTTATAVTRAWAQRVNERDAIEIFVVRYRWHEFNPLEQGRKRYQGLVFERLSFADADADYSWVEYQEGERIEPTLTVVGITLLGPNVANSAPLVMELLALSRHQKELGVEA